MLTLRHFVLAVLALAGVSMPLAAYTGYYAPVCGWTTVWALSGDSYQYVCL
jgi:hypothetical protein